MKEWRAREAAYPVCLPTTLRILNPANLFCNLQCTTVCITAAGSRVVKHTPGMCPRGCPSGFARQDCRSITEWCFRAIQAAWSRPGNLSCRGESGEPTSLTGRSRESRKTEGGSGYAWATRGYRHMCRCARQGLVVVYVFGIGNGHLSGCLMVSADR